MSPEPGLQLSLLCSSLKPLASASAVWPSAPCLRKHTLSYLIEPDTQWSSLSSSAALWICCYTSLFHSQIPLLLFQWTGGKVWLDIWTSWICDVIWITTVIYSRLNIPWEHDVALSEYLCILNWASARLYHPVLVLIFFNPNKTEETDHG